MINEVSREGESALEKIDLECAHLVATLEEHRKYLHEKVTKILTGKRAALNEQEQELGKLVDSIEHVEEVVTLCVQSKNAASKATCRN